MPRVINGWSVFLKNGLWSASKKGVISYTSKFLSYVEFWAKKN